MKASQYTSREEDNRFSAHKRDAVAIRAGLAPQKILKKDSRSLKSLNLLEGEEGV